MKRIENVEITKIRSKNRVRKDVGDLSELIASMRKHGLINPITVTAEYDLVAGQRRLHAAQRLGWNAIPCRIVDGADETSLLEMEIDENSARKDFGSDEMADALIRLDRLRNPGWWRRLMKWLAASFQKIRRIGKRRRSR